MGCLGGAGRGSGELGGAHAGIPPGDPGLGIHGGSRRKDGERREERREERRGRGKGEREGKRERGGDDDLCKDKIDLNASSRGR